MKDEAKPPVSSLEFYKRVLLTPHGITLIAIWLISTVSFIIMLCGGVRKTGQYRTIRDILQVAYVLSLIWYLIRTGPSIKQLPDISPVFLPKVRIGKFIPLAIIILLFISEFYDQDILRPLLIIATIWTLITWRREIRLQVVLLGLALTLLAIIAGLPFYQNQAFDRVAYIVFAGLVMPMFIAGDMLSKRTGLVGSQLYTQQYKKAVMSFLWGCLLFIPQGLSNAAAGSPSLRLSWWVDRWWIPWTQPWFSGIVEEAWWRLFVISLAYFLLRPVFSKRPAIAIVCAVLFSAIPFGLGHGGTFLNNLLSIGLLYGLSMAVIFTRRDWEHAVGAHYMINMIPTLMVFLKI
jgi:hypothetical protein